MPYVVHTIHTSFAVRPIEWSMRPCYSRWTYLSSLGRVTVKSPVGLVNAIENPLPPYAILLRNVGTSSLFSLASSRTLYYTDIYPLLFLHVIRYILLRHVWLPVLFVYLFVYRSDFLSHFTSSIGKIARIYVHCNAHCTIIFLWQSPCSVSVRSLFFLFSLSARVDVHFATIPDSCLSWRTRHYDIRFLRVDKFEQFAIFRRDRKEILENV